MSEFEKPSTNIGKQEFTPEQEDEITRKWYGHTSFEGRTKAEFDALREEVRKATTVDFNRRRSDRDYRRLLHENPLVNDFLTHRTLSDLADIYEAKDAIGLSEEQFEKLLATFGPEIQEEFHKEHTRDEAWGEAIREAYKEFTPEEIREHLNEATATMKTEIELQEQNIPHQRKELPGVLPRKKKSQ